MSSLYEIKCQTRADQSRKSAADRADHGQITHNSSCQLKSALKAGMYFTSDEHKHYKILSFSHADNF